MAKVNPSIAVGYKWLQLKLVDYRGQWSGSLTQQAAWND